MISVESHVSGAAFLVSRHAVLNEMRTIDNVLRALMREIGVKLGAPSRTIFASRVRERRAMTAM
ncbi:hypothetical protein [Foliimonas ilicis]